MKTKTEPTNLLEIATSFDHWSEYLDVDGSFEQHELAVADPVGKLMQMQECGFSESYRGDMYDSTGHLMVENVLVEIDPASCVSDVPTITVGDSVILTQEFQITSDTLTGPGGWYVVVRGMEGGEE